MDQSYGSDCSFLVDLLLGLFVFLSLLARLGGLEATARIIDFSEITQLFDHYKVSSISQFSNGTPRYQQKLVKYFNVPTTSVYNILKSATVLRINFVLYLKDFLVVLLLFIL